MRAIFCTDSYKVLDKNPLNRLVSEVDSLLKKYDHYYMGAAWRLKLRVPNPCIPRAYGLPKIHKQGNKMREIIDNTFSPTYKISKWLVYEFAKLNKPQGKSVSNTLEFVENIKNLSIEPGEVLVSFDVTALFPSIPINETLRLLEDWLRLQDLEDWKISMYIDLTNLCMTQSIFTFDSVFYQQTRGTAMGNSLSPFLADLFMSHFEERIKDSPSFPRIWHRYVDDIFAIQDINMIQATLDLINSQYECIKFTCEVELDGSLPFLDVRIIKTASNTLEFDIYRKPTNTPRFIMHDSHHSFQHRYAAFRSMIHRLLTIPLSKERFLKERQHILDLAKFNGLNSCVITNMLHNHKLKLTYRNETTLLREDKPTFKFIKMTYFPNITSSFSGSLEKHKIKLAYSSASFKLRSLLGSPKDEICNLNKSGIYKIDCIGCDSVYIGMTSRQLLQRFKDHIYDIGSENEKTAISKHIKCENNALGRGRRKQKRHGVDIEKLILLKPVTGYRYLAIWESIFIEKYRRFALNDNFGLVDSLLIRSLNCC